MLQVKAMLQITPSIPRAIIDCLPRELAIPRTRGVYPGSEQYCCSRLANRKTIGKILAVSLSCDLECGLGIPSDAILMIWYRSEVRTARGKCCIFPYVYIGMYTYI